MRNLALAGLFALAASTALAQTGQPTAASPTAAEPAATGGGPANLCQELLAFVTAPPPAAPTAAPAPAKPAASQAATPSNGSSNAASSSGQAVQPDNSGEAKSAQAISGQSGVSVNAPAQNGAPVPVGTAQNAPQKSSRSAPVPNDSKGTPKSAVMSVEDAQALVDANDIGACRDAAQKMRRAGVVMPPPLLALAALDPKYFNASSK